MASPRPSELFRLLHRCGALQALSPELEQYKPSSGVAEFRKNLLKELDFGKEVNNLQQVARNCADDPVIHIPAPYPDLSTRKVLTMERLDGYSVADTARVLGRMYDGIEYRG